MGIGAAIGGAGLLGGIGSIIGGQQQASGQEAAANTQWNMFNTINKQEQPFIQGGYGAETQLNEMLAPGGYLTQQFNPTMQQLEQYPGYQFALQQGEQAINNQNAPTVGALSGPALKSLMSFNQGLASQTYQNAFNNFQTQQNNIFNRLSGIASLGQNAASQVGNAGAQLGTGVAQAQAAAAGSQAAGTVGAFNSLSGAASTLPLYMMLGMGG